MTRVERKDDGNKGRFTIYVDDKLAGEMTYTWAGKTFFIIDHTAVFGGYNGKGYGKQMVLSAVDFAREQKVKILPLCPFAKRIFYSNEEISDVVHK